ncbi:glycoside hydrolase family 78 protein [Colletotrichum gloeosporioides 23]|nr:glycoside hydrolase family 78 protein [Colletotrichum gloeosporioides 23]
MNGTDKAGTRIVFWPAERLFGGNPSQSNTGSPVFDGYTLAGNESETYGVRYRYHGLRHVCVNTTWAPQLTDMVGYVIRATNDEVGTVQTSNSFLNKLYEITDRSMKYGANSEGLIPTTAPEYDVFPDKFRDDPNWGSAIMRVAMHLYRYYGDTRVPSENYDIMVAYMDYLGRRATDSVIEGAGLSDWAPATGRLPPCLSV